MSRVGVGVIGAGVISNEYLTNLTQFPDLDVRFVADIDRERAAAQAAKYGVPASGSVDELLADDQIELVVNLTIPTVHVEVALTALAAGKHVWSEKPFALDRASGKQLLEAAEKAGLRVATAPDTFLGAGVQTARRLIDAGEIGRPLNALTLLQNPGPESWHPNPDFLFQEGAGPLFDLGPYYITALVQLMGPVRRVSATASTARSERVVGSGPRAGQTFAVTVPSHHSLLIEFANGSSAQSVFSFESALPRTLFEVSGENGTLVVPDVNTFTGDLELHDSEGVRVIPASGSDSTRGTGVVETARAIRAGVPERASGELAYHVLDVMVSAAEAAASGQAVDIESTVDVAPPLPETWSPLESTLT